MLKTMRYTRENPIATRLLGLIILSSSAITLVAILMQLYATFHDDVDALNQRIDQVKISTLASITQSLWSFDQEQLSIQIDSLLDVEDVVQVQVSWRDWSDRERTRVASRQVTQEDIDAQPNQFLVREYPLVYEDATITSEQLGTLTITASLENIYARLWDRTFFIVGIQGTKTIIIALFILWLVHTLLTRHMDTIAHYARHLHLDNLTTPLRLNRIKPDQKSDELDNVVNAINHMRETLLEDIEQRHAIELALLSEKEEKKETRRQKMEAEDASRAKSQFLATMSHEIRTPMNGVIGMLDILRDTPLNETQQHYLDVIHRSGESLLDIINDILDYSKIEAGKMQLEVASFDLEGLVDDCLHLFGATASKRNIDLMGGVHPDVPSCLEGDPTRLRQIIINLLGNAFKFTSEGHVALEVTLDATSTSDQPVLHFSVQDTGIGIEADTQDQLFDAFNQADSSTTRQYGGTGLGLAICRSLVELMGGELGLDSVKGQGATFWFTAKLRATGATPHYEKQEELRALLGGRRLLLIEPCLKLGSFLAPYCQHWGITLEHVTEGQAAMATLQAAHERKELPDFIALGCHLPDMDGIELARWLHQQAYIQPIPRFCLNAGELQAEPEEIEQLGIRSLMRKPISTRALRQELAGLMGQEVEQRSPRKKSPVNYQLYSHLKVLVAEDNAVNRMVVKGLLGKMHIEPELVENGAGALAAIEQNRSRYDVILMDCEMPEMDGFEATRRIRRFERRNGLDATPIVALTAHALQEHREAVFACGMNDYLGKPITLNKLYATFERMGLLQSPPRE
ncbi:response regulator [Marinimicrobium sp. ABcell2]|uniref:response regulator n=1 Tax=Marinimicrobium sp. ABcell2 TaxID=3069751 RepID=UPI0027ADA565|nr:response regulator [Marinimicrobium sp. ABcell2]MDQ2076600.1 response regulator [Marinimicrobium sp. ABcell2]